MYLAQDAQIREIETRIRKTFIEGGNDIGLISKQDFDFLFDCLMLTACYKPPEIRD